MFKYFLFALLLAGVQCTELANAKYIPLPIKVKPRVVIIPVCGELPYIVAVFEYDKLEGRFTEFAKDGDVWLLERILSAAAYQGTITKYQLLHNSYCL